MKKLISIVIAFLLGATGLDAQIVKIACVGNSITYGSGIGNRDKMSYPAQLQAWLGSKYQVRNFGVSGSTMLRKGDKPYWDEPEYKEVMSFKPDIVIIKLGTNDSKPQNWQYSGEFEKDYTDMALAFKAIDSKPRVLLALPVPVFVAEKWGIRDSIVRDQIIPIIKNISRATRCQYIDLYTPLLPYKYAFPDDVHPNSIGASVIVEQIYRSLFYRDKMHSSGYLNTAVLPAPGAECRGAMAGWGDGNDWYSQFEAINKIGQDRKVDLVLLGNSITQGWGGEGRSVWSAVPGLWDSLFKPLNAANFGISGDRTQHILWRIQNGNFDKVKPQVIALEIGVNNFADNSEKEIAGGIQAIIRALQKKVPAVKIILFGPLPTGNDNNDLNRMKYKLIHQIIAGLNNGKNVFYENLDKHFIDPDGTLVAGLLAPDGIHLTAAGYRVWANILVPEAKKLMKN
ncbi:MAG: GDSL-type esterase/lipase family protein [Bacteroidia bacterium]|nr:GDSL-type esterase/lipase family protein [Bacteroidia bacterium]